MVSTGMYWIRIEKYSNAIRDYLKLEAYIVIVLRQVSGM